MLKFAVEKWNKNKETLKRKIENDPEMHRCYYSDLVRLVIRYILNDGHAPEDYNDDFSEDFEQIDNGDYQGTYMYILHRSKYQPSEYDYFVTYVDYGSCTVCDTLQGIQSETNYRESALPTEQQVDDYMMLCLHIVQSLKQIYPNRWNGEWEEELVENENVEEENKIDTTF